MNGSYLKDSEPKQPLFRRYKNVSFDCPTSESHSWPTCSQGPSEARVLAQPKGVKVTDVLLAFKCSSCQTLVQPPIAQCERGHPICQRCLPSDEYGQGQCSACSRPFSNERNLGLEALASVLPFPCKFATEGCPEFVLLSLKREHEEECSFQLLPCPFCTAMLNGSSKALAEHLSQVHRDSSVRRLPAQVNEFIKTYFNVFSIKIQKYLSFLNSILVASKYNPPEDRFKS